MKTPDEIMTGLIECNNHQCARCGYNNGVSTCIDSMLRDVLALIQQLQAQNAEQTERIQQLEAENKQYYQENTEMYLEMCMLREKVHRLEATVSEKENVVDELSRKIG